MKRLLKKALNTVLQDSFKQDIEKAQHPQEENIHEEHSSQMNEHTPMEPVDHEQIPEHAELPEHQQEIDEDVEIDDDGMGFDQTPIEDALINDHCSMQVLYQQVKLLHWIVTGENYIATHRFFDEVADALLEQIDLLAERLVFLEINPIAEMKEVEKRSYVDFTKMEGFKFDGAISIIDEGLEKVIEGMKNNVMKAGDSKNVGTEKMLQDFVYDLEVLQHHIRSFKG